MEKKRPVRCQVAVVGGNNCSEEVFQIAYTVGAELAARGAWLICGGLGGVMEAVSRGATENGGHAIGILPGYDHDSANRWLSAGIATGLGHARNVVVVAAGHVVIALPGAHGTAAEVHLARVLGRPVVALSAWGEIPGVQEVSDPRVAVELALKLCRRCHPSDHEERGNDELLHSS
jgi:uncharacterized protein (TIGR00725 family)